MPWQPPARSWNSSPALWDCHGQARTKFQSEKSWKSNHRESDSAAGARSRMVKAKGPFKNIVQRLEVHYGRPQPPKLCDPLHLILFESIGYLVDDDRREAAFEALQKRVGLKPAAIVAAPIEQLIAIARL